MTRKRRRRGRKKRARTFRGCLARLTIVVVILLSVITGGWWWIARDLPDVTGLKSSPPETTAFIERDRATGRQMRWTWVDWSSISPNLKRAVLVSEDINFFGHDGFETTEIEAAIRDAIRRRRFPRGASTISQQVAKNMWLSPDKSFSRKIVEAIMTRRLERELSKRRILEIYLNIAQMGPGLYGAEAASQHYFAKPAADLDERQAALLAASLPRPSSWNPASDSTAYDAKARVILTRMERADWLNNHID